MKYSKSLMVMLVIFFSAVATAQNKITLHISEARGTISKNIYGHFAEHPGNCIYGGFYVGKNNKTIPNKNGVRLLPPVSVIALTLN